MLAFAMHPWAKVLHYGESQAVYRTSGRPSILLFYQQIFLVLLEKQGLDAGAYSS